MLSLGMAMTSMSASRAVAAPVPAGAVAFYDFLSGAQFGGTKTFTRASTATYFDSALTLQVAPINVPRITYATVTGKVAGLWLETAVTNAIRNSSGAGAVAGSPGTLPDFTFNTTPANGINRHVVGATTEAGMACYDIRFAGTASGASSHILRFDYPSIAAAAAGQTWTNSLFHRVVAGSATGTAFFLCPSARSAADAGVDTQFAAFTPNTSALNTQRTSITRTLVGATIDRITSLLQLNVADGATIDCTLRLAPQLEQAAAASSFIPTSTATVTRAADVLTLTPASGASLTWRALYNNDSTGTIATGITGAYVVDPATLALPRVKMIWAATS